MTSNFSFSHSVFKGLVQQTCKNQGLFGKGLTCINILPVFSPFPTMSSKVFFYRALKSQVSMVKDWLFARRQILHSSKRKEFADVNFKLDENGRKLSRGEENTVVKGEIACYKQFLFFPQCFQKACFPGASKGVIVWEWINSLPNYIFLRWSNWKHLQKTK